MWKLSLVFICLLLAGCTEPERMYAPKDAKLANKIQSHVEKQDAVKEANVYIVGDYVVVALELSPWQRYKKGKIEQDVTKYLKKHYEQFDPIVSADRKLHFELAKLPLKTEKQSTKRLGELQKLLQEET